MSLQSGSSTWSSYRQLLEVVNACVFGRSEDLYQELEATLRRHKPDLLTLVEKPKKNRADREEIKRSTTPGVSLSSEGSPTKLPPSVIAETLQLSDLLELNEKTALELLLVAEQQLPRFPQYSRQQVAILLFQDGRQSVYTALRALVQARDGNMWTLSLSPQVTDLIMRFTDDLYENGLVEKVLQHLSELKPLTQTSRLKESPVGDGRLLRQVADLVVEQRNILADCLFFWSCQQPFYCEQTLNLLQHLKKMEPGSAAILDHVGVALVNTLFQCFTIGDLLLWQQRNDDERDERYPVTSQQDFIKDCHKEVLKPESEWAWTELGAAVKLTWGVLMRECSKLTLFGGTTELEDDERMVVAGIKGGAFNFLRVALVGSKFFHQEELFVKHLHQVLTSLIVHMHLKVKEMCYHASDQGTGRSFIQRSTGGKQATNLQDFLYLLGDLYGNDTNGLGLSLEYWCVPESDERSAVAKHHSTHRQLTLLRFLHTCCDVLQGGRVSPSLFLAFLHLLKGLANSQEAANCCYTFLCPTGSRGFGSTGGQKPGGVVSWDHFFQSMKQYYIGLKQDLVGRPTSTGSGISPDELNGLLAVLHLTRTVVERDEVARTSLFESQSLSPIPLLFGLVTSSVPRQLKAEAFLTLAAFARSPEIASSLWIALEQAQVVRTIPVTSTPKPLTTPFGQQQGFTQQHLGAIGSIELELEEIESQEGDYCETRGFLTFMDAILDVPIPPQLGHAHRATPGFTPYLCFLVDRVFMNFEARSYKDPLEKWQVAASVLEVLHKLLVGYQVCRQDFVVGPSSSTKHPGFTLLLHLMRDSKLLRKVLSVLSSCAELLEEQASLLDAPDENMERTALLSLKILEVALEKQDAALEAVRSAEGGVRMESLERLDRLLVCLDGTPEYLIKVMRYIPMLQCSPELALSAVNVLCWVVRCQKAVRELVYALDSDKDQYQRILHGFVERLECVTEGGRKDIGTAEDIEGESPQSVAMVQESIKTNIMRLILFSVDRPAPNLAHLLLGYNINKQLSQTELQNPGIMGAPYTVLHSVVAMVAPQGETLSFASLGPTPSSDCSPQLKELAYCLLYNLCRHSDLAGPTLRYLRHNFNFFCVHLKKMPFEGTYSRGRNDIEDGATMQEDSLDQNELAVIRQEAWFLKTLAIELHITAQKRYFSQTHQILSILLAESSSANQSVAEGLDQGDLDGAYGPLGGRDLGTDQKCIAALLSKVDFTELAFSSQLQLQLQHFELALIQQVAQGLMEVDPITSASQVNIKAFHRLLVEEVNQVPGLAVSGRAAVMKEVHDVLVHFVEHNRILQNVQARMDYFEGWRQVVELMFAIDGGDRLKGTSRLALVLELLQDMLLKLNVHHVAPELASSAHGLVVGLMSHLRHTLDPKEAAPEGTLQQVLRPTSLQALLKGLADNLMQNGSSSPQLRTFIYGSLLYYIQLSGVYSKEEGAPVRGDLNQGPWMEYSGRTSLSNMNIAMLNNYGENLMEMVCKDASSGHDVTKMLSLALLGAVIPLDRQGRWLRFMIQKGYLRGLATSVHWEDEALQKTLLRVPEPLKALYVYESKMAFLSRVATNVLGTRELLATNTLVHLSECKFIGMRPSRDEVAMEASSRGPSISSRVAGQPSVMEYGGFVPSVMERYHQLLFPVLRLMASLLNSSGPAYNEAAVQVMRFVESHVDAFVAVLNQGSAFPTLATLHELALVTMVISRAGVGYDVITQDPSYVNPVSLVRVQTAMSGLISTFWSVSNWKDIVIDILENEIDPSTKRKTEQEAYTLVQEISANLAYYCRINMTMGGEELTSHSCKIVFSPELLLRATSLDKMRGSLSLGLAVIHLRECVDNYPVLNEELQKLERKLDSEAELEDSEMLPEDQQTNRLSIQEKVLAARRELVKHTKSVRKQLMLHSLIMENTLYLIWRHLQFYLVHCKPSDFAEELIFKGIQKGGMRRLGGQHESTLQSTRNESSLGTAIAHDISHLPDRVTRQQLEKLREDLPHALTEPLLKKLIDIEESCIQKDREVRVNFVQAVVRRIRRLLQQHCPPIPGL